MNFFANLGVKGWAIVAATLALVFYLLDQAVVATLEKGEYGLSGAIAVVATTFLMLTVVSLIILFWKLAHDESDKRIRQMPTPRVIRGRYN